MPAIRRYKVKQTKMMEIGATSPGAAADAARFLFEGKELPDHIAAEVTGALAAHPRIVKLEVDEQ